jgi:hypothetical protein
MTPTVCLPTQTTAGHPCPDTHQRPASHVHVGPSHRCHPNPSCPTRQSRRARFPLTPMQDVPCTTITRGHAFRDTQNGPASPKQRRSKACMTPQRSVTGTNNRESISSTTTIYHLTRTVPVQNRDDTQRQHDRQRTNARPDTTLTPIGPMPRPNNAGPRYA